MHKSPSLSPDPADDAAAQWFIRRDRGLNEVEQAEYAQWLQASPSHAVALARVEKLWSTLDPVFADRAIAGAPPDADLLAPPRPRRGWWIPLAAATAAAAAGLFLLLRAPERLAESGERPGQTQATLASAKAIFHPGPERMSLPDGSVVELAAQAKVEVQFTAGERRVRLVRGTAFFTVAKNPARPFIVSTDEVSVRAVGTAFSVGLNPQNVSVLVTEGRVQVQEVLTGGQVRETRELSDLDAGQQGIVHRATADRLEISVTRLTAGEIERVLWWQGPRLEFADLPLDAVVAEFNRHTSGKKLVIRDATTAAIRVGGNFRADNVTGFLHALEAGFNISAVPHGDEIILRQGPPR